jgi:hypothetical protein
LDFAKQNAKFQGLSTKIIGSMLRPILIIVGIVLAAIGGAIAYRAWFLEPSAAVVITSSGDVRELPNYARIIGGSALFIVGTAIALTAARRKP